MSKKRKKTDLMTDLMDESHQTINNVVNTDVNSGEGEEEKLFECDCRLGPNESPCYTQFDVKDMVNHRMDYQSCDYWDDDCYNLLNERMIAIMSVLINDCPEAYNCSHKKNKKRRKTSTKFLWRGRPVCKKLFLVVHAIKKPKWTYLKKRYVCYGVEPRQHQNKTNPVNSNAINSEERKAIVDFIRDYAKQNAQNPNSESVLTLGSDQSVKSIYRDFGHNYSQRSVSYETFRNVWKTHCPNIKFETKNDKTLIIEFIKSYARRHSTQPDVMTTSAGDSSKVMYLSAEHNVKIVYFEFKQTYNCDISYDVFNTTWKTSCPYIKFENSCHYNKRKCSHCGLDGHTNRKIGDHFLCPLRESQSGMSGLMRKAVRKQTK